MSTWTPASLGSNISTIVSNTDLQFDAARSHERGTTTPPYAVVGQLWAKTDHSTLGEALMYRATGGFTLLMDPDFAQVNAGGTVAFAANQPMGGFKLTGLGAGAANGESVRYEQVVLRSGALAMTGNLDLGGNTITNIGADLSMASRKITNLAAPSADSDAARKVDADAAAATCGSGTTSSGSLTVTLGYQPGTIQIDLASTTGGAERATAIFAGTGSSETRSVLFVRPTSGSGTSSIEGAVRDVTITRTSTSFTVAVATLSGWAANQTVRYVVHRN